MSSRPAIWIALFTSLQLVGTASAQTLATGAASANPATQAPAPKAAPAAVPAPTAAAATPEPTVTTDGVLPPPEKGRQGFDLLAMAAFGKATEQAYRLDVEPYAATFGLDSGYTWSFGLRLAASLNYGLGRTLHQQRDPLVGPTSELTTEATALNAALSVGHDLWLRFLILRYTWSFGVSWMHWDFESDPPSSIPGYATSKGSTTGFYIAPGLVVLWPYGRFTGGLGFDYLIQINDQIPSGIVPKLLVGVKL